MPDESALNSCTNLASVVFDVSCCTVVWQATFALITHAYYSPRQLEILVGKYISSYVLPGVYLFWKNSMRTIHFTSFPIGLALPQHESVFGAHSHCMTVLTVALTLALLTVALTLALTLDRNTLVSIASFTPCISFSINTSVKSQIGYGPFQKSQSWGSVWTRF